ncbi:hypothetical protein PRIPAC_83297 [Pristionchus pacificus]|uniref:Uncharacterized protein n=1 Tax=Pristionchus pacificus TaxID=54126 RepID=A0A2A6BV73_PRIPA|nr:hypothetical protein PRIPAC_83297 [Pristionchus pacificus]|eukprot:PDM69661.1 hypothetical protein PRIPAC_44757 [Pristionchus pacificus]
MRQDLYKRHNRQYNVVVAGAFLLAGCGYCLYVGKIQNKRRSYWTSLESKKLNDLQILSVRSRAFSYMYFGAKI